MMNSTKNLKIVIAGLILLLVLSLFYNPFNKAEEVKPSIINTEVDHEIKTPVSVMDVALIKKMVDNYKSNQLKYIQENLKKEDAQSIWFDLKTIKDFVTQIEENTKKNDSKINSNALGLRLYYASYPSLEDLGAYQGLASTPKDYEKLHTIIMIPTIKNDTLNLDFNPLDVSTYKKGVKIVSGTSTTQNVNMMMAVADETSALNHGLLSPPNRNPSADDEEQ